MLELRALCAGYHDRPVLRDVDLVFRPGKVLALLGPNGCGKSTLLRTAAGLLPSQGGTVLLAGEDSIREIIPFPMNKNAQDVMMGSPSTVDPKQLDEVHIAIVGDVEE